MPRFLFSGLSDRFPFTSLGHFRTFWGKNWGKITYPFTAEERDAILRAIATDQFCPKVSGFKHPYYLPLITFLFKTGCRPSEAVALEWGHITEDLGRITFQQRAIYTKSGRKIVPGLKNG